MAERTSDHIDQPTLAALGRGMLDHDEMADVETHLAFCESCCEVLSSLPDDEFVASLRTAADRSDPTTGIWRHDQAERGANGNNRRARIRGSVVVCFA